MVIRLIFFSALFVSMSTQAQTATEIRLLKNKVNFAVAEGKEVDKKDLKTIFEANVLTFSEIRDLAFNVCEQHPKIAAKMLIRASSFGVTSETRMNKEEYIDILGAKRIKKIRAHYLDSITPADLALLDELTQKLTIENHFRWKWIRERDSNAYFQFTKLDSINFIYINKLLFEDEYCGRQKLYIDDKMFPIFLHTTSEALGDDEAKFEELRKKLLKLTLEGKFDATAYAVWVDRFQVFNLGKEEQIYGMFRSYDLKKDEIPKVQNREKLDEIRMEIGLKTVEQEITIRTSKSKKK